MTIREFLFSQQYATRANYTDVNLDRLLNRVAEMVEQHDPSIGIGYATTTATTTTTTYCNRIDYINLESVIATIAPRYS